MYVQNFVKGIAGISPAHPDGLRRNESFDLVLSGNGIMSNWWRKRGTITPTEIAAVPTAANLDRHLHDYDNYGAESPFISLASGCVERDAYAGVNRIYSAIDTALIFATDYWSRPGALYFGWTLIGLNCAVEIEEVAEAVRELHVYQRRSPYQLEGEMTAKVNIPSNHIQRIEWWDGNKARNGPVETRFNPDYIEPSVLSNCRELF